MVESRSNYSAVGANSATKAARIYDRNQYKDDYSDIVFVIMVRCCVLVCFLATRPYQLFTFVFTS